MQIISKLLIITGSTDIKINGESKMLDFANGIAVMDITDTDELKYHISFANKGGSTVDKFYRFTESGGGEYVPNTIPLWLSLLPPLIAILMALVFREVIISLFAGIWFGALVLNGFNFKGLLSGFFDVGCLEWLTCYPVMQNRQGVPR